MSGTLPAGSFRARDTLIAFSARPARSNTTDPISSNNDQLSVTVSSAANTGATIDSPITEGDASCA